MITPPPRIDNQRDPVLPASILQYRDRYASRAKNSRGINRWLVFGVVAGVVALAVVIAGTAVLVGMVSDRAERRAARDAELEALNERADAMREHALNFGPDGTLANQMNEMADQADQAAARMGGAEGDIMRAGTTVTRNIQTFVATYEQAYLAFEQAGGIDAASMSSKQNIATRIGHANRAKEANAALTEALRQAPGHFRRELENAKVSASMIRGALAGFQQSANIDISLKIRETDRRLFDAVINLLKVLQSNWGQWEYDHQQEAIVSENDAFLTKYETQFNLMTAAADEQLQLQQQMSKASR